jgi:hypothetical protein
MAVKLRLRGIKNIVEIRRAEIKFLRSVRECTKLDDKIMYEIYGKP